MYMTKPVAIIIINYKMEWLTVSFVKNELSRIEYPHKIIIINNEATITSNSFLSAELGAAVIEDVSNIPQDQCNTVVLSSIVNLGFAKANNLGAAFCQKWFSPDYILFSNNDIQIKDLNVIDSLIGILCDLPDVGVVGPKVIGLDGIEQSPFPYTSFWVRHVWRHWSSLFYSLNKRIEKFNIDYPQKAKEGYHYYVMGSFFMVRASDFYNCGMFDPTTFLYAEEMILAERMRAIGKLVYYYPDVTVVHAHGKTTKKYMCGSINDVLFESECYYYRKYKKVSKFQLVLGRMTHGLLKRLKKN